MTIHVTVQIQQGKVRGGALQIVTLSGSHAALKGKGETMPLSMMMRMDTILTRASAAL